MVEQLAGEYAGQNIIFIEQDVDALLGARMSRFWAANGYGSVSLPLAISDSGAQFHSGYDFNQYNHLKAMVDTALARPKKGEVAASASRIGNHVRFDVQVTNQSGATLSASNGATLSAIVYEDIMVNYTNRWVRAAPYIAITNLANGATGNYTVNTADLSGVDWSKLHYLVIVDYRPGGSTGAYDVINSAIAISPNISPNEMFFPIDPDDSSALTYQALLSGVTSGTWTASANRAWITITPATGSAATPAMISVNKALLASGLQSGTVTFSLDGEVIDTISVSAFLGELTKSYLPLAMK